MSMWGEILLNLKHYINLIRKSFNCANIILTFLSIYFYILSLLHLPIYIPTIRTTSSFHPAFSGNKNIQHCLHHINSCLAYLLTKLSILNDGCDSPNYLKVWRFGQSLMVSVFRYGLSDISTSCCRWMLLDPEVTSQGLDYQFMYLSKRI